MDQIVGIIALVFCAGILICQYAVRRKRDKISDFMAIEAGINEVALGRKINMTDYRTWKRHFDNEQKKEDEIARAKRRFERACFKDLEK